MQDIYRHRSDLIVVFLSGPYNKKTWCGLEWRAIRDLIKEKQDNRIMLMRFDDTPIPGTFSIDGYVDVKNHSTSSTASLILDRLAALEEDRPTT